jgi:ATP-dependent Clp protease adaptor protein ClpS
MSPVMMADRPTTTSTPETTDSNATASGWKTILFNCDCHTFADVAAQLMKATSCTYSRGMQLANVVHYTGSAIVFSGAKERCEAVADVLAQTGLRVSVDQ